MQKIISVKNLIHFYKKIKVLNDLSFSALEKEFFIITGPNGSGKTTLVTILAGIIEKKKGVKIAKREIGSYTQKELARKIAFVPQDMPADFPFTLEEFVLMGRSPHLGVLGIGDEKDASIAKAAMEFTAVEKLYKRHLNELSGGERQRAFISRALCQEPEILILDEPTAALDLSHTVHIMELLQRLKSEKNMTIIMVTHDLNLAAMYAEKLLLLKSGKIAKIGTPAEVFNKSLLEEVYNCDLIVDKSPAGDFPRITLCPQKTFNF